MTPVKTDPGHYPYLPPTTEEFDYIKNDESQEDSEESEPDPFEEGAYSETRGSDFSSKASTRTHHWYTAAPPSRYQDFIFELAGEEPEEFYRHALEYGEETESDQATNRSEESLLDLEEILPHIGELFRKPKHLPTVEALEDIFEDLGVLFGEPELELSRSNEDEVSEYLHLPTFGGYAANESV